MHWLGGYGGGYPADNFRNFPLEFGMKLILKALII
jgi:hypothetical protein